MSSGQLGNSDGFSETVPQGAAETQSTREKLILAGIEELNTYGIHRFSTRRVAKNCGVSCAAPYKHFKDTHAFIAEILKHINRSYSEQQKETLKQYRDCDSRTQLLEAAVGYIRFLTLNPEFRRIIMQNYGGSDPEFRSLRAKLSLPIYKLVTRYCQDVNMPIEVRRKKTFVVRSLIYGAALFFDNGEMTYNEESMEMIRGMLDREFDLP